jgi:mRNA-degrading endonuclease RelE of RelBE toxin-antitoxin system
LVYRIELTPEARAHLAGLTANQRRLVLDAIQTHLVHQPTLETRNRKRMRQNLFARWELRVRDLRVYYLVEEEPEPVVRIRGIGVKVRDRVWIGGEEVDFG